MKEFDDQIVIRRAGAEDVNLISVLGAVTFYEAYFEQDDPPDLANYIAEAFAPEEIRLELEDENSTFFIIFEEGKAVGYAKLLENSKADCIERGNSIELKRIYILERVYGTGIGEILLKHCIETAKKKGFKTIWLGVWEENHRALRFYKKFGFHPVGKISFPYGATVGTNIVMAKDL
jgi:ribosomal protein S18 acetylase RimI-like enzyme